MAKEVAEKLIPVQIRPHLIPFLYKEMEGTEANYMSRRTKSIKIYPFSSLGKFFYSQMSQYGAIGKQDQLMLYLVIEKKSLNVYYGYLYASIKKVNDMVYMEEYQVKEINNLIEDIFRISFIYYVDGFLEHNAMGQITQGIDRFIEKYDLLELGFNTDGLRRLYYREKAKGAQMSRMQYQSATRVNNFDIDKFFGFSPQTMSQA